jgi:hypothetical protein
LRIVVEVSGVFSFSVVVVIVVIGLLKRAVETLRRYNGFEVAGFSVELFSKNIK